jgi:hypothetical protein
VPARISIATILAGEQSRPPFCFGPETGNFQGDLMFPGQKRYLGIFRENLFYFPGKKFKNHNFKTPLSTDLIV